MGIGVPSVRYLGRGRRTRTTIVSILVSALNDRSISCYFGTLNGGDMCGAWGIKDIVLNHGESPGFEFFQQGPL
jgi:hypothetical protein